jgi:hypothetical protein
LSVADYSLVEGAFADRPARSSDAWRKDARYILLHVLGEWLGMQAFFNQSATSFVPIMMRKAAATPVDQTQFDNITKLEITIGELVQESALVPIKSMALFTTPDSIQAISGVHESEFLNAFIASTIERAELNIYTLRKYANVTIKWTDNLSRHLLLTRPGGKDVLEIFDRPSILWAQQPIGVKPDLMSEVLHSYGILFAPESESSLLSWYPWDTVWRFHRTLRKQALRKAAVKTLRENSSQDQNGQKISWFDEAIPPLVGLQNKYSATIRLSQPYDWDEDEFPNLWPRIEQLYDFQRTAKPWKLGVLLSDTRDSAQFWGFL